MSTALLEIASAPKLEVEPQLAAQAEVVLNQLGSSVNKVFDSLLRFVVARKKIPDVLERPNIPSLDDMTKEEFDALIQSALDDVKAGRMISQEDFERELREQYGVAI